MLVYDRYPMMTDWEVPGCGAMLHIGIPPLGGN